MPGIFKSYDIRGIYPDELDEVMAQKIGIATGNFLETGTVVVGHDMRRVAEPISEALVEGLRRAGQDVIDVGLCSTPMNYRAIGRFNGSGGVMVTASHNPSEYIGFKISREEARPVGYDSGIETIEKKVQSESLHECSSHGAYRETDYLGEYVGTMLEFSEAVDSLSIAVDTGNGMGGLTVPKVLEKLPVQFDGLYLELDGSFPNHTPNPLKRKNVRDLQDFMIEDSFDMGVAFDGDADRVIFLDETGEVVPADLTTALLARRVLAENPNSPIVYDLRSSRVVREEIEEYGGTPVRFRVGHSYMKSKMREVDAPFGGELSGHYYYRKNYYTDCGLITMLDVINLLSERDESFSELVAPLRERYVQSGEINFEVNQQEKAMNALEENYADGDVDWLDGITVQFSDWWFNVRPSNTEPLLRLNLEAKNQPLMEEKVKHVSNLIEQYA